MGWYVTCKHCGSEEKYKHPNCGCQYNSYLLLQHKIRNSLIIDTFCYNNEVGDYICNKYNNDTYTIKIKSKDDWFTPSPYTTEITLRKYNLHKLRSFNYNVKIIDQLFIFHQFLNHQDILSVIALFIKDDEDDEDDEDADY